VIKQIANKNGKNLKTAIVYRVKVNKNEVVVFIPPKNLPVHSQVWNRTNREISTRYKIQVLQQK